MGLIDTARSLWQTIRDETAEGANTPLRVGDAGLALIDAIAAIHDGLDGRGITSITRTSGNGAAGTTDTYTITYSDSTTSTFTVANGNNGNNGNNGRGITSITRTSGNGAAGTTDTYTITFTDDSTTTFTVVNGANGNNGIDGSSNELGEYVLSGLNQDIKTGLIVSETVREKHSITAASIYAEVTTAPTSLDIVFDIKKNGVSIFSTLPKISAGNLAIAGTQVLSSTTTTFNVGDIRTIFVNQVGLTESGKNLVTSILMNKIQELT